MFFCSVFLYVRYIICWTVFSFWSKCNIFERSPYVTSSSVESCSAIMRGVLLHVSSLHVSSCEIVIRWVYLWLNVRHVENSRRSIKRQQRYTVHDDVVNRLSANSVRVLSMKSIFERVGFAHDLDPGGFKIYQRDPKRRYSFEDRVSDLNHRWKYRRYRG